MTVYEELIKNLRHDSASALQNCEFDFVHDWMLKAADAIEELQKQLREEKVDNVNLTGWLAEEHAKLDNAEIENIKLKEEFAKYRGKHRWISVTERLPEVGEFVLVYRDEDVVSRRRLFIDVMVTSNTNDIPYWYCNDRRVLYWVPLPQPPESERSNEY